jgi:A/G-specific adenine glycosylase
VLTRVLGYEADLASAAAERGLWSMAQALLPARELDIYTQGLMDIGATVCLARRPACERCPLAADCVARLAGAPERYPVSSRRTRRGRRENALLWLQHSGRLWLVQRPASGVWGGLWSLPEYESRPALERAVAGWPGGGEWLPAIEHALTHFDWMLHPLAWCWPAPAPLPFLPSLPSELPGGAAGRWATPGEALALGLPAPVRRLLGG